MKVLKSIFLLSIFFLFIPVQYSFAQTADIDIEKYKNNVVQLTVGNSSGFGFVIGSGSNNLYIITAKHVVEEKSPGGANISVRYYVDQGNTHNAELMNIAKFNFDAAVIVASKYPEGLNWQKEYYCPKFKQGEKVWYIGRKKDWSVAEAGVITSKETEQGLMTLGNSSIHRGTSGAPLITRNGIVGLITNASGSKAKALNIKAIQVAVSEWGKYWQLIECDAEITSTVGSTISGKIITPMANSRLLREFDFEVEIIHPDSQKYYYLVNEVSGSFWPKNRIYAFGDGGSYSGQSNEGGNPPNGVFYIVLFEVDKEEHQRIIKWWEVCNEKQDWPGTYIDGTPLDRIKVKLF